MSKITIAATINAATEKSELVKAELLKLVALSRSDAGCIHYDLHQDNESPLNFLVY